MYKKKMYDYYNILSFINLPTELKKITLSSVLSNQGSVCSLSKDGNFETLLLMLECHLKKFLHKNL